MENDTHRSGAPLNRSNGIRSEAKDKEPEIKNFKGEAQHTAEVAKSKIQLVARKGKDTAIAIGKQLKARPWLGGLLLFLFGGLFITRMVLKRR